MFWAAWPSRASSSQSSKPGIERDWEASSSSPLLSTRIEDTSEVRALFLYAPYQHRYFRISDLVDHLTQSRGKPKPVLTSSRPSGASWTARDRLTGAMCD